MADPAKKTKKKEAEPRRGHEPRTAPVSANKSLPASRIDRRKGPDVAEDPIPDRDADERNRRRDARANPATTAERAEEVERAKRPAARRNHEIPISLGPASVHDEPFVPVGTGEEGARRAPRLFESRGPQPRRTSDPTRLNPFLEDDPPELADNPRETIAAREEADGPEHGAASPGAEQDQ